MSARDASGVPPACLRLPLRLLLLLAMLLVGVACNGKGYVLVVSPTEDGLLDRDTAEKMCASADALAATFEGKTVVRVKLEKDTNPETAIKEAIAEAVASGKLATDDRAAEVHTIGHGCGASIDLGLIQYHVSPTGSGRTRPIDQLADFLSDIMVPADGKLFLWHCNTACISDEAVAEMTKELPKIKDKLRIACLDQKRAVGEGRGEDVKKLSEKITKLEAEIDKWERCEQSIAHGLARSLGVKVTGVTCDCAFNGQTRPRPEHEGGTETFPGANPDGQDRDE